MELDARLMFIFIFLNFMVFYKRNIRCKVGGPESPIIWLSTTYRGLINCLLDSCTI